MRNSLGKFKTHFFELRSYKIWWLDRWADHSEGDLWLTWYYQSVMDEVIHEDGAQIAPDVCAGDRFRASCWVETVEPRE